MKKLLTIISFVFLTLTPANSEMSLGVSGSVGMLEANGKETFNNDSQSRSEDLMIGYAALFGEAHLGDNIRVGASIVPYSLGSETTENQRNDNCTHDESGNVKDNDNAFHGTACSETLNKVQVDLENIMSFYISYHMDMFFLKAGVINADLVTNESLSTGSSYADADLEGTFFGAGFDKDLDNGMFIRSEVSLTKYDDIKLTSTGSDNTNTIDVTGLDGMNAAVSVGKTFLLLKN